MNRKIFLCLLLLINFSSLIFAWSLPLDVDLVGIEFDHGTSGESIDIRENSTTDINKPEYVAYYFNYNKPAAYIKSQTNRRIEACFITNYQSGLNNLQIGASVASGSGFSDVTFTWVSLYQDPQDSSKLKGYTYFPVSGHAPSTVGKYSYSLDWIIIGINNTSIFAPPLYLTNPIEIGTSGTHTCYTLLGTPQSPMTEPWTDVLDYSCIWASGTSSSSSAIENLTNELYTSGVEYDGGEHYTRNSYRNLDLTGLLSDFPNTKMDCRDFSNFIQVLSHSLGFSCRFNNIGNYFYYNYLKPAGLNSVYNGFWNFHQVGWYNSKVVDPSTKIDNDSDPTSLPNSWKLVGGDMTLSNYLCSRLRAI